MPGTPFLSRQQLSPPNYAVLPGLFQHTFPTKTGVPGFHTIVLSSDAKEEDSKAQSKQALPCGLRHQDGKFFEGLLWLLRGARRGL
jgi:hypothetical protein